MGAAGRNPLSMSSANKPETLTEETEKDVDDASAGHTVTISVSASSPVINQVSASGGLHSFEL